MRLGRGKALTDRTDCSGTPGSCRSRSRICERPWHTRRPRERARPPPDRVQPAPPPYCTPRHGARECSHSRSGSSSPVAGCASWPARCARNSSRGAPAANVTATCAWSAWLLDAADRIGRSGRWRHGETAHDLRRRGARHESMERKRGILPQGHICLKRHMIGTTSTVAHDEESCAHMRRIDLPASAPTYHQQTRARARAERGHDARAAHMQIHRRARRR